MPQIEMDYIAPSRTESLRYLLRSPLRVEILSYLHDSPQTEFSVKSLSQLTGRMRVDVENCLKPMVDEELVVRLDPSTDGEARFRFQPPSDIGTAEIVEEMLQQAQPQMSRLSSIRERYFSGMIGRDEKMMVVFEMIHTVAKSDISVLILGATGTGKELVAHAIHELSHRAPHQFVAINCASIPETLIEAELFGYEKGAFTGAYRSKVGKIELAHKGTLFLDEIGDMPLQTQVKLLRVLETRQLERVGSNTSVQTDFRLICATNQPLEDMLEKGTFREDLYYRINVFPIRLPALKERVGDVPILAEEFLKKFCRGNGLSEDSRRFTPEAYDLLKCYEWPGNIRELENAVSRVAVSARGERITPDDLRSFLRKLPTSNSTPQRQLASLDDIERDHIQRVLHEMNWNIKASAEVLGISRGTLYKKMEVYGFKRPPR